MELSPELLTSVTFKEQWRGYSPDQVDEVLERVAEGVGELQTRLRETERRASEAERRLADVAADDEIRRTLLLAQRTAASAVEEARAEAGRLLADAEAQAAARLAMAEARLGQLEVEFDKREREQLGALADRRAALEADIASLEAFAADNRTRLRAALEQQLEALDGALELPDPPATSGIVVGAGPTAEEWASDPDVAAARAELIAALAKVAGDPALAAVDGTPEVATDLPAGGDDDEVADDEGELGSPPVIEVEEGTDPVLPADVWDGDRADVPAAGETVGPPAEPEEGVEAGPPRSPVLFDDAADEPATGETVALTVEPGPEAETPPADVLSVDAPSIDVDVAAPDDDLPEVVAEALAASTVEDEPVEWRRAVIGDRPDDDPFLAELRRAVTDTEPLGPRDDDDEAPYTGEVPAVDAMAPPGRFRRRRARN